MKKYEGEFEIPGDKSITHRAILFSAIANSSSTIRTNSLGRDNFASLRAIVQLGAKVKGTLNFEMLKIAQQEGLGEFFIEGQNLIEVTPGEITSPEKEIDCGNSGTTSRLLSGILASYPITATLTGDHSLKKRPFKRIREPLERMGAVFSGDNLPLTISGGNLRGINYYSPVASAQVKSAILIAGLRADGEVSVLEDFTSRDHTEKMFAGLGCDVHREFNDFGAHTVKLGNKRILTGGNFEIPGDFSSASFFLVLGAVSPGSVLKLKGVGFNPTRIGLYALLRRMGAKIELSNFRVVAGEEIADLTVTGSELTAINVTKKDVVLAIDEIPILAVAAAFSNGTTIISGAEELRVKESDRLKTTAALLMSFGVSLEELPDGLKIVGNPNLIGARTLTNGGSWQTSGDHRIAMCGAIFDLCSGNSLKVRDKEAVETSFPTFYTLAGMLEKK